MDYYKILGLNRNASKEEIKEAYRNLALQFHPDKHSGSPKSVKDGAILRFKQVSEAYQVLINDGKRADYNFRNNNNHTGTSYKSGYGYHNQNSSSNYGYGYGYSEAAKANREGFVSRFEFAVRFLTTRDFLLNLAFAGAILGATVIIDTGGEALWKIHNPGKSFEEAMESIEKTKTVKEKA